MKNPCDNCLIKVNCTALCFAKKNYKTLLQNAVHVTFGYKNHSKYSTMLSLTSVDELKISERANKALNPELTSEHI